MLARDFQGQKIYRALPEDKRTNKDGTPRDPKRLGRIHFPVFTPSGDRLVGFMVTPPEVAAMVKLPDRFVAFDAISVYEGVLVVADRKDAYDQGAARRLNINLDTCLIWTGMDVITTSGTKLGYCADTSFNPKTGAVEYFSLTRGATASALLGDVQMPASYLRGYRDGFMVVDDAAASLENVGGAAAKAAEVSVVVGDKVKRGAKVIDDKGSVAVEKGSRALGRQLGKTRGMFTAFKDEFKKAAGPAPKKRPKK